MAFKSGVGEAAPIRVVVVDELQSRAYCPECETETTHDVDLAGGAFELTCTGCGTTQGEAGRAQRATNTV